MAKRKIEAEVELSTDTSALDDVDKQLDKLEGRDVEVDAAVDSRDVERLEDRLDDVDGRRVEVDATVDKRAIDRFDDQLDGLSRDAIELRVEFKRQALTKQIASTLRELERLEDPVDIEASTQRLEAAQAELRELADLADRKYEIEIDADPKRTAQRAAGDIDSMRQRGEGLQSALPAIRGFGDELGTTAGSAGIASQAVADLGDFSLIMGERFASAGSKTAALTTKLGTALGAAGLAGAIGGIAVQLGQVLIPKLQDWLGSSDDVIEANDELIGSFDSVAKALAEQNYRDAVDAFLDSNDDLLESAARAGVGADDLARFVLRLQDDLGDVSGTRKQSEAYLQLEADAKLARGEIQRSTADQFEYGRIAGSIADDLIDKRSEELVAQGRAREAIELAASALDEQTDAVERNVDSSDELIDTAADVAQAELDAADAVLAAADARRAAADADFALRDAQRDLIETLSEAADVLDDQDSTLVDVSAALDDVALSAGDVADAAVRQTREQYAARGATLSQLQATQLWNSSMLDAAATADGPLRRSILDYIASVNDIPASKLTEIEAALDEGDVARANALLNEASRKREAEIEATARKDQAERDLNDAARDRTSKIDVDVVIRRGVKYDQSTGTFVPTGRSTISDTQRRALAAPLSDDVSIFGRAATADSARSYARAGDNLDAVVTLPVDVSTSRGTTNVQINLPRAAEARDVVRVVERWSRVNGRA